METCLPEREALAEMACAVVPLQAVCSFWFVGRCPSLGEWIFVTTSSRDSARRGDFVSRCSTRATASSSSINNSSSRGYYPASSLTTRRIELRNLGRFLRSAMACEQPWKWSWGVSGDGERLWWRGSSGAAARFTVRFCLIFRCFKFKTSGDVSRVWVVHIIIYIVRSKNELSKSNTLV